MNTKERLKHLEELFYLSVGYIKNYHKVCFQIQSLKEDTFLSDKEKDSCINEIYEKIIYDLEKALSFKGIIFKRK